MRLPALARLDRPLLRLPADLSFFSSSDDHPDLHSFPTRRSSDLGAPAAGWILIGTEESPTVSVAARGRKSTRLNSSHVSISYAVFCLKKKNAWPPTGS